MQLDVMKLRNSVSTLTDAIGTIEHVGIEKTHEALAQINLLLQLLQSAGYGISSLDVELTFPPKVSLTLTTGPAVKEEKLNEILHDHAGQTAITMVIASLIEANKLRGCVTVETLELESIEIAMTATPCITLQWQDKDKDKKAAA
jgi:hypothetical protein